MKWLKKNLIFTVIMVLLAGALGFEVYLILGKRATAVKAEENFQSKVDEHQALSGKQILPHTNNVDLTRQEIERQRAEQEIYEAVIRGDEELAAALAAHPTSSTNALFGIQFFVEEYRDKAAAATQMTETQLAGEYFGFQAYAQTGPREDLIPIVYKQQLVVSYILDQLFAAQPESLVSVSRPGEGGASEQAAPPPAGGRDRGQQVGRAGFRLSPDLTAAIPGVIEAEAYQVVFTGRASTLRTFLNTIAQFEMPLVVRSVEVAPAGERSSTSGQQEPATRRRRRADPETVEPVQEPAPAEQTEEAAPVSDNIPLVANNVSQFTVAMEYLDLVQDKNADR